MKNQAKTVLAWKAGAFKSGEFAGPFWGAKSGDRFLMIVPRAATPRRRAYYELWLDGIVYDETKSPTLQAAKKFAVRVLAKRIETAGSRAAA